MTEESTTPDLVELTRQCFETATRLDFDSMISLYDPDRIAWDVRPMGLGLYEGEAAVRAFAEEFLGTFEDYWAEVLDIEDIGNGVVNVIYHQEGRMPGSDALATARAALVYEWRDGLIVRMTSYIDIDEARAAAERLAKEQG
jgi:ketosteroid isomerase-like protein